MRYDCAIVGGGPAGLSAALVLGRAGRAVILIDNNEPRNAVTHASHGFLTRDGVTPTEFRRLAYEEVLGYPSVQHRQDEVTEIRKTANGEFSVIVKSGYDIQARKLLLSSGLKEVFPDIAGFYSFYGKSVFNCPYCDGWEQRDQPLLIVAEDSASIVHMTKLLYSWSKDLLVCTSGLELLSAEQKGQFAQKGIAVIEQTIKAFHGTDGMLEQVEFSDGAKAIRSAAFIKPKFIAKQAFADRLGYERTGDGRIAANGAGQSSIPGMYVAGDTAYIAPSQIVYAAASGTKAAMAINGELADEDFG
ncbi:NAD(P)/FAD-dependent oxidoreductase [Paenibacillus sp. GCM10027626]|uniref:NAD(P)/FAD-dependent oxidoreductase n=1 Tax=Paenibacillus sp. GCM10027626 TaxID=3273411 RepID=UPI0036406010